MKRPVRARRACPSFPCSCEAQGPVSLTGVGPAFSRLQLADGCLWPLLAQAAQSCHPHWYHQAFAHRHSRRARPPRAHARSPSTPACMPHVHGPRSSASWAVTRTSSGTVGTRDTRALHTLHHCTPGHPQPVCPCPGAHAPQSILHSAPLSVCTGVHAQLCRHPLAGLCLFF